MKDLRLLIQMQAAMQQIASEDPEDNIFVLFPLSRLLHTVQKLNKTQNLRGKKLNS